MKLTQVELHAYERPIALQSQLYVNNHRDPKKSKAATLEDFYMYQPRENKNLPRSRFGAAAMALIQAEKFPYWALFCYKDLAAAATGSAPELLCFTSETAILLAPEKTEAGYTGLLIALEEAGNQRHIMRSPCGKTFITEIGHIHTKVVAKEGATLPRIDFID